jgi:trehalose 6-phosphate synthase/phosphatase
VNNCVAEMSSEEQCCNVEFKLFYNADKDSRIVIVGESHHLGFWDPANGKQMLLASPGCWVARINLPQSQKVVFKFVIIEGNDIRWETGRNRELCPRGSSLTFESLTASFAAATVPLESNHRVNLFDISHPSVRLIVASFRLPFLCTQTKSSDGSIVRKWEPFERHRHEDGSEEQLYIINKMRYLQRSVIYIGWPGIDVPKHQEAEVTEELRQHNCVPVFLKPKQLQNFNAFFMGALSPIFHSVLTLSVDFARHFVGDGWKSFLEVNMAFKKTVIEVFGESDYGTSRQPDIIFIMGAQLLMLPKLLARSWGKQHQSVPVCMALDCPIPSSDIFRNLPMRAVILESILSADLVSFQSYDYLRHFTYACSRLLGYELQSFQGGFLQLVKPKLRPTFISTLHVGIDVVNIEHLLKSLPFRQASEVVGKELDAASRDAVAACDHLFVGYDELVPTSGAVQKLIGFLNFLELQQKRAVSHRFVLVQVLYPGGNVSEAFKTEVERTAARVNEKFPYSVLLIFGKLPFDDRACLFRSATCFVKTSLREGLTLIPFEFVLANATHGAVIFAEFMACSRSFPASIRVNPFNVDDISQALDRVVSLSQEESRSHHALRLAFVQSRTVTDWARQILSDTIFAAQQSGSLVVKKQIFDVPKTLSVHEIGVAMARSKHLFMIVEHDLIRDCFSDIREHLASLSDGPNVQIYIFSHLAMSVLTEFYSSCPHLGLISDDGHLVKYCKSSENPVASSANENDGASYIWRDMAEELMLQFSERTSGTKVVSSDYCCSWIFSKSDPEFGMMQAKELTNHLESMFAEFQGAHVAIRRGAHYIKAHLEGDSIEDAVHGILSREQRASKALSDTVWIGLGGKSSDERLFEYLQERKSEFNAVFGASLNDNAEYVLIEEQLVGYFKNLAESDALGKIAHFYLADGAVWPFANFTPTKLNPDSNIEDCDD